MKCLFLASSLGAAVTMPICGVLISLFGWEVSFMLLVSCISNDCMTFKAEECCRTGFFFN